MKALAVARPNFKSVTIATLVAIMALSLFFGVQTALASDGNFDVSVYHGINGRSLGLSKDLPVNIWIYNEDGLLAIVPDVTFKERFNAELPAGEYTIMVESVELGAVVESMTLGPVEIPEGADLAIRAKLSGGKTPILAVRAK